MLLHMNCKEPLGDRLGGVLKGLNHVSLPLFPYLGVKGLYVPKR